MAARQGGLPQARVWPTSSSSRSARAAGPGCGCMLSRVLPAAATGLPQRHLIGFDNLHRKSAGNPADISSLTTTISRITPATRATARTVLRQEGRADGPRSGGRRRLAVPPVEVPDDRPRRRAINDYPSDGEDVSLFDFVMRPSCGLPKIIDFMNGWARELPDSSRPDGDPLRGPACRSAGDAAPRPRVHRYPGRRRGTAAGGGIRVRREHARAGAEARVSG